MQKLILAICLMTLAALLLHNELPLIRVLLRPL